MVSRHDVNAREVDDDNSDGHSSGSKLKTEQLNVSSRSFFQTHKRFISFVARQSV